MEALRLAQSRTLQQLIRVQRSGIRQLHSNPSATLRTRPSSRLADSFSQTTRSRAQLFSHSFRYQRRNFSFRRWNSTSTQQESLSLSQRLKKLSREYGWAALGVYLALTALDLPFCFLAVRAIGAETVGHYEHIIVSWVKDLIKWPVSETAQEELEEAGQAAKEVVAKPVEEVTGQDQRILEEDQAYVVADHGYQAAEKANSGPNASEYSQSPVEPGKLRSAGIWTELALAYALHKTFIFVRVPITAAITPKVVKTLRSWGWNIGKMPKKGVTSQSKTGVNTKGSKVKSDD
jgi:N-terminal acetyltransferase 2